MSDFEHALRELFGAIGAAVAPGIEWLARNLWAVYLFTTLLFVLMILDAAGVIS